jgi:hypothetical protein
MLRVALDLAPTSDGPGMRIDAAVARLIKLLAQMAEQSQAALTAGSIGNEIKTRYAVDALRLLHAKRGTIDQEVRSRIDRLPMQTQDQIRQHLSQIQSAKIFVHSWSKRYQGIVQAEELSLSAEGRNAILDYTLPLDWHFQGDVFVLFGKEELAFVPELNERRQKRILFVGSQNDIDPQLHLNVISAPDALALREYFAKLDTPMPLRLSFLKPQEKEHESQGWKNIKQAFTLAITNNHTMKVLGNSWMTQGLANLQSVALSTNLAALKLRFKGFPTVIIISPGPSLDKNIHLLKALKGRTILMAAAQCARALQVAGVVPDFVVVADPGDLAYFLDGVDTSKIEALMVGVSCHPAFYKLKFKNIITFNANGPNDFWISEIFGDTLPIAMGGSVTIDCFFIAKYLQFSNIIMVGLDLSLSAGKAYSTQSANSECTVIVDEISNTLAFSNVPAQMERIFIAKGSSSEDAVEALCVLPGYYGGTVQTRPNYHHFHGEFVEMAKYEATQEHPISLINCTEGGVFIEGFRHIPLQTAITEYVSEPIVDVSEKIEAASQSMDRMLRTSQCVKAKISLLRSVESSLTLTATCKSLVIKPKLKRKQLDKLNKAEKKLIRSVRTTPFISLPNVKQMDQLMEIFGETSTVTEINNVAEMIYDTIEVTCKDAIKILNSLP